MENEDVKKLLATPIGHFDRKIEDAGAHYRFKYRGINLDPFRIAQIYDMDDFCMMTILKKTLCAGRRGHKDFEQDLKDIICAAQRKLEMLKEDSNFTEQ